MIPTLTSHNLHPLILPLGRNQLKAIRQFILISQTPYSNPFSYFTFLTTFHSDSPYPEVRASVSSIDNPLMPVNTFRMWFLGIFFTLLTSGFNQVFSMRCKSLSPLSVNIMLPTSS